jgi:uncharacterized phage protein (TIGR01671 family)
MTREILFRGKRVDNGQWVYGYLCFVYVDGKNQDGFVYTGKASLYSQDDCRTYDVLTSTVGQFTGLTDKNGKKIFEGDIVKTHYKNAVKSDFVEQVVFYNGKFCAEGKIEGGGKSFAPLADGVAHIWQDKSVYMESCEVIGNIHDNPELLEASHE